MPTPGEVLNWDVAGLQKVADNATAIADVITTTGNGMQNAIYGLAWTGEARTAAEGRADREQSQVRAIATAYDELAAICSAAARDISHPVSEIGSIFQYYVSPPVTVGDDWSIDGVEDWNSESGIQLARLSGLVGTLQSLDAQWGAKIAAANDALAAAAPPSALATINASISATVADDPRSDPERLRTSAAAFQEVFGRPPTSVTDWATAEVLNPKSTDPKYQGVSPEIRVVRIQPVPGQGVVRTSHWIEQEKAFNIPKDLGDNRTNDPDFDPEQARITTYIDYENGLVVMRQNPSVSEDGEVDVAEPEAQVWQAADGSVRINYDAANPHSPDPSGVWTVNGDLVFVPGQGEPGAPGSTGVTVHGTRTDYPSLEVYQTYENGHVNEVAIDPAVTAAETGALQNLPFHHPIPGSDPEILDKFKYIHEYPGDQPPGFPPIFEFPGTAMGGVDDPPIVVPITPEDRPLA